MPSTRVILEGHIQMPGGEFPLNIGTMHMNEMSYCRHAYRIACDLGLCTPTLENEFEVKYLVTIGI